MDTLANAVTAAISAHTAWNANLSAAVSSGQGGLQGHDVARDDLCAFGRWLMGDPSLREAPLYAEVLALHARFHLEAARVLDIALEGRTQEAAAAMERGSAYDDASSALLTALAAWRAAG